MDLLINNKEKRSAMINDLMGRISSCILPKNIAIPLPIPKLKNNVALD